VTPRFPVSLTRKDLPLPMVTTRIASTRLAKVTPNSPCL
jgi:hypothetical protein